jgi:hypothetical protein
LEAREGGLSIQDYIVGSARVSLYLFLIKNRRLTDRSVVISESDLLALFVSACLTPPPLPLSSKLPTAKKGVDVSFSFPFQPKKMIITTNHGGATNNGGSNSAPPTAE